MMKKGVRMTAVIMAVVLILFAVSRIVMDVSEKKGIKTQAEFVLRYGEVNSEGHIMAETAHYFAEQVEELSAGKILIEIYPSGQLGDDARCYQMMKMGALDLYRGNSASLTGNKLPMAYVMALPYLFGSSGHFWRVCKSKLGKRILDDIEYNCEGMLGLTFLDEGARCFFTTDKKVSELEDMKGMNMRMQDSDIMIDTLTALGANAVPMEYVEVYSALKGKRIDGAENPPISYYYNKFYEVAPYYVKDAHTYAPGILLVSKITWEKLGKENQDIIMEAAGRAQEYNRKAIEEAEKIAYKAMEEEGAIITELKDLEKWQEAMEPVYKKYAGQYSGIIKDIRDMQ